MNKFWFFILIILSGCYGNESYIDIDSQEIRSCNKKEIRTLYLHGVENDDYFKIKKKRGKKGNWAVCLTNLDDVYYVESMFDTLTTLDLQPNSVYLISNNTYGDAASPEIKIKTGLDGKIIESSVTICR